MKGFQSKVFIIAVLSASLICQSCGNMLTSLAQSINELNEEMASTLTTPIDSSSSSRYYAKNKLKESREAKQAAQANQASRQQTQANQQTQTSRPQTVTTNSAFKGTPYTVLPAGTDGSAGKKATYVLFGDWPQAAKPTSVTIDESNRTQVSGQTYYKGSDGKWYVKIKTKKGSGYEGNEGFRYTDGTRVKHGEIRYFRVDPIKWRVVSTNFNGTGTKLLLAEHVMTSLKFNDIDMDHTEFKNIDGTQFYFKLDRDFRYLENGGRIHHNNYEHSRVRAFLNGLPYIKSEIRGGQSVSQEFASCGFLQTAFTPELQEKIAVTTVDNSLKSTGMEKKYNAQQLKTYTGKLYYESGEDNKRTYMPAVICGNTKDKVFILSYQEATRSDYGFSVKKKEGKITWYNNAIHTMTDFAKGSGVSHPVDHSTTLWLLRTPCVPTYYYGNRMHAIPQGVLLVTEQGTIVETEAGDGKNGVLPAICVK